jgi:hypothetical protein
VTSLIGFTHHHHHHHQQELSLHQPHEKEQVDSYFRLSLCLFPVKFPVAPDSDLE